MTPSFQLRMDPSSGVPFYRQIIDSILLGLAQGALQAGEKLPTVRQAAVELSINPNTVIRAYKELEIRGIVTTQQGTGTFITNAPAPGAAAGLERRRQLDALVSEFLARAGGAGFRTEEVLAALQEREGRTS